MQVTILNPEQIKNIFKEWGEFAATCYNTPSEYAEKVGNSCYEDEHYSGSRTEYIKFKIEGIDRGCYDDQTDILTKDGWKKFDDIAENEVVATLNNETNMVEFHQINEKIKYHYKGEFHNYNSQAIDLAVTSNHNMYIRKHDTRIPDKYKLTKSDEILVNRIHMTKEFNYNNSDISEQITIHGFNYTANTKSGTCIKNVPDLILNRKLYFKFLAWYLSDGSMEYSKKENKYTIHITQTKCEENIVNNTRGDICEIIKNLGFLPYPYEKGIKFTSMCLGKHLKELGLCNKKHIPFNLFDNFNKEYAQIFLNEYFRGDGYIDKNGCGKFYTTSEFLANQLHTLTFIAGWSSKVYTRGEDLIGTVHYIEGRETTFNYVGYVVNVSFNITNKYPIMQRKDQQTISQYDGLVYCVNVPNHIIFVRRNGIAIWCGNCAEQAMRHEIGVRQNFIDEDTYDENPSGIIKNLKSFRYVDMENFDYTIPKTIQNNEYALGAYRLIMTEINGSRKHILDLLVRHGIPEKQAVEDANYLLPRATNTSLCIAFTLEAFIHYLHKRLCTRTQDFHRQMANLMKDAVLEILPQVKDRLVPQCEYLLWCPEKTRSCKKYPTKEMLLEKLKKENCFE